MGPLEKPPFVRSTYLAPLIAGATAGISVDVALYPLDTLKTRLQSEQGFQKAGGFRGVYKGLLTVATTSMPTTALFFMSYETTKRLAEPLVAPQYLPLVHSAAACVGEVLACLIRVPTEIAKQRKQIYVGKEKRSSIKILLEAYKAEGLRGGVYRGFLSTVARDLPFSFLELPVWEFLKGQVRAHNDGHITSFQAGATAGISVDVALYPLDTLKTRLQSEQGFQKAGGFRGVYKGLLTVATTSMPTTALFFMSYETTKRLAEPLVAPQYLPLVHSAAACVGEVLACLIRVPTEIAKQRKQIYVGKEKRSSIKILLEAYKAEGLRGGVYRGFLSTVARDLPFSFLELPVWEFLKGQVRAHNDGHITSFQSALCGSIAGGFAAAATTPLDLAKTRIMLSTEYTCTRKLRIKPVLLDIYHEAGWRGLFAGVTPRLTAFMAGGFVFFGVYDDTKSAVERYLGS